MVWINKELENNIKRCFPQREVYAYCAYRTWQSSRFLWVTTILAADTELHYEYIQGRVELHLEGKYQSNDYREFVNQLRIKTSRNSELTWERWQNHHLCRCVLNRTINGSDDLHAAFQQIMNIFDPIIESVSKQATIDTSTEPYSGKEPFEEKD